MPKNSDFAWAREIIHVIKFKFGQNSWLGSKVLISGKSIVTFKLMLISSVLDKNSLKIFQENSDPPSTPFYY